MFGKFKSISKVWLSFYFLWSIVCCKPQPPNSEEKTVDIPATEDKLQGDTSLCWAYTIISHIESEYKRITGLDINLSEEALAFSKFTEALSFFANIGFNRKVTLEDLKKDDLFAKKSFEDGRLISPYKFDGFVKLLEKYGVVPESVWSYKVPTANSKFTRSLDRETKENFYPFYETSLSASRPLDESVIIEKVLTPKPFPTAPPFRDFTYKGMRFSGDSSQPNGAVKFLKEFIRYDPKDFELVLLVASDKTFDNLLGRIKRVLAAGYTVPFTINMNLKIVSDEIWNDPGESSAAGQGRKCFGPGNQNGEFVHTMLLIDFVNQGGQLGPSKMMTQEVEKPIDDLDYLYAKNWFGKNRSNSYNQKIGLSYLKYVYNCGFRTDFYLPIKVR